MDKPIDQGISLLDEAKIQANVIVPILKALRKEIGVDRADRIVASALHNSLRSRYEEHGAQTRGNPKDKWLAMSTEMFARIGGDIDVEWISQDIASLSFNVTGCRYADFFRQLGEPDLGAVLLCELDNHVVAAAGPGVELARTQTVMRGATHCDFRYHMREKSDVD